MIKIHKTPKYVAILNNEIYKQKGIIGSEFYSNRCGKFKVLKISGKTKDRHYLYQIIFNLTNEIYYVRKKSILSGEIKDYLYPTILGIGFLGKEYTKIKMSDPEICKILRSRWKNMISRIYNSNDKNYINYGAKGITISSEWHNFSNFYNDIVSMNDFNRDEFLSGFIDIDKDIKQYNIPYCQRIYSKDTISLVNHTDNMKYINFTSAADKQSKYFIVIDSNNNEYLYKNISKFSRNNNIFKQNICKILNNNLTNKSAGGYKYRYPTNEELLLINSNTYIPGNKIN